MAQLNILAICGSLRTGSYNRKLVLQACDILKTQNCNINFLDLRSLNIPLYDGDLEDRDGVPPGAQKLIDAIQGSNGMVVGNPEYNSGITGVLKNAIDWATRGEKNPFIEKTAVLMGTSSGYWGAVRAQMVTRQILTHLGTYVLPTQVTIPFNEKSFDEGGGLKDPAHKKLLETACAAFVRFTNANQH
jgi:chromate reductase, NAD(P)H dehydrogenase (quinone)